MVVVSRLGKHRRDSKFEPDLVAIVRRDHRLFGVHRENTMSKKRMEVQPSMLHRTDEDLDNLATSSLKGTLDHRVLSISMT